MNLSYAKEENRFWETAF